MQSIDSSIKKDSFDIPVQLISRYVYIALRENLYVSTEVQMILDKVQVYEIFRIRINVIEKNENNAQYRT